MFWEFINSSSFWVSFVTTSRGHRNPQMMVFTGTSSPNGRTMQVSELFQFAQIIDWIMDPSSLGINRLFWMIGLWIHGSIITGLLIYHSLECFGLFTMDSISRSGKNKLDDTRWCEEKEPPRCVCWFVTHINARYMYSIV